jgi:hypothetical protein
LLSAFVIVVILLALIVLLGPYRVEANGIRTNEDRVVSADISTTGRVLNIGWRDEPDGQKLVLSIFGFTLLRRRLAEPESDENKNNTVDQSKIESDGTGFRFPFKLPFWVRKNILDVLRCFEIKRFNVQGIYGTGDPATTGLLYGFTQPLQAAFGVSWMDWTPDFLEKKAVGRIELAVRFTMASLLWRVAVLAFRSILLMKRQETFS